MLQACCAVTNMGTGVPFGLVQCDWMHRSRASWVSLGLEPGRTGGLRRRLTTDSVGHYDYAIASPPPLCRAAWLGAVPRADWPLPGPCGLRPGGPCQPRLAWLAQGVAATRMHVTRPLKDRVTHLTRHPLMGRLRHAILAGTMSKLNLRALAGMSRSPPHFERLAGTSRSSSRFWRLADMSRSHLLTS